VWRVSRSRAVEEESTSLDHASGALGTHSQPGCRPCSTRPQIYLLLFIFIILSTREGATMADTARESLSEGRRQCCCVAHSPHLASLYSHPYTSLQILFKSFILRRKIVHDAHSPVVT
jgi:hypothetical protein